jgi:hypothetical protein
MTSPSVPTTVQNGPASPPGHDSGRSTRGRDTAPPPVTAGVRFLLGTHQPGWLRHAPVPLFVSDTRLRTCLHYALTWRRNVLAAVRPTLWEGLAA